MALPGNKYPLKKNYGDECWSQCSKVEGRCSFCGTEGLCCRKDKIMSSTSGCSRQVEAGLGRNSDHTCT